MDTIYLASQGDNFQWLSGFQLGIDSGLFNLFLLLKFCQTSIHLFGTVATLREISENFERISNVNCKWFALQKQIEVSPKFYELWLKKRIL
jgi:hypothetical protein